MPATSGKQFRLMAMVKGNPDFAKKKGIPQHVGAEMVKATPKVTRKKFMKQIAKPKTVKESFERLLVMTNKVERT